MISNNGFKMFVKVKRNLSNKCECHVVNFCESTPQKRGVNRILAPFYYLKRGMKWQNSIG